MFIHSYLIIMQVLFFLLKTPSPIPCGIKLMQLYLKIVASSNYNFSFEVII